MTDDEIAAHIDYLCATAKQGCLTSLRSLQVILMACNGEFSPDGPGGEPLPIPQDGAEVIKLKQAA
jgi:hypothetical protein